MNTNIEMNDIKAKVRMLKADNERLTLDASDWREKHRLACAENVLLLDQRDTCWESHKGYEAENERLCMELVEKDMLPARLRATITQQDELLNMHDAELERLRAALEEIKLLDEWHTKADAKDIARKALEQSDE